LVSTSLARGCMESELNPAVVVQQSVSNPRHTAASLTALEVARPPHRPTGTGPTEVTVPTARESIESEEHRGLGPPEGSVRDRQPPCNEQRPALEGFGCYGTQSTDPACSAVLPYPANEGTGRCQETFGHWVTAGARRGHCPWVYTGRSGPLLRSTSARSKDVSGSVIAYQALRGIMSPRDAQARLIGVNSDLSLPSNTTGTISCKGDRLTTTPRVE